jgi:hypothetical protein
MPRQHYAALRNGRREWLDPGMRISGNIRLNLALATLVYRFTRNDRTEMRAGWQTPEPGCAVMDAGPALSHERMVHDPPGSNA